MSSLIGALALILILFTSTLVDAQISCSTQAQIPTLNETGLSATVLKTKLTGEANSVPLALHRVSTGEDEIWVVFKSGDSWYAAGSLLGVSFGQQRKLKDVNTQSVAVGGTFFRGLLFVAFTRGSTSEVWVQTYDVVNCADTCTSIKETQIDDALTDRTPSLQAMSDGVVVALFWPQSVSLIPKMSLFNVNNNNDWGAAQSFWPGSATQVQGPIASSSSMASGVEVTVWTSFLSTVGLWRWAHNHVSCGLFDASIGSQNVNTLYSHSSLLTFISSQFLVLAVQSPSASYSQLAFVRFNDSSNTWYEKGSINVNKVPITLSSAPSAVQLASQKFVYFFPGGSIGASPIMVAKASTADFE